LKQSNRVSGTATFIEKNGKVTLCISRFKTRSSRYSYSKNQIVLPTEVPLEDIGTQPLRNTENGVLANIIGDIGNFTADASGNATITLTTDEWNIGSEIQQKTF
jgi:Cu-Zn family superoxide dismutase